jgi:hypothetical protein
VRLLALVGLVAAQAAPVGAHAGPPFPIIVDQTAGPYRVSVWADPDIGVGTFYVTMERPDHGAFPDDVSVDVIVQPVSGRLSAQHAQVSRDRSPASTLQFFAQAEFDRQELWTVHVEIRSSDGGGDFVQQVEATPPGLGRWDILWYLLPFLAVGFLWASAIVRKRTNSSKTRRQTPVEPG